MRPSLIVVIFALFRFNELLAGVPVERALLFASHFHI